MLTTKFTLLLALVSSVWAAPVRREVPQEHSHEQFLTIVNKFLKVDNPDGIVDAVFALLGNAAAQQGLGKIADPTCLQLATADRAFTNAKAAGDVEGQVGALIYRALERNTGKVGQASDACESIEAVNPEIAAIQQHQDPASPNAAEINKAITLELAKQIKAVGGNPLDALKAGTFAPGDVNDPTGAGNSCDDLGDPVGCIFTKNLLVPDASEAEILAAVGDDSNVEATTTSAAAHTTSAAETTTTAAETTTSAAETATETATETTTSAAETTATETTSAAETTATETTTSAAETTATETTTSAAEATTTASDDNCPAVSTVTVTAGGEKTVTVTVSATATATQGRNNNNKPAKETATRRRQRTRVNQQHTRTAAGATRTQAAEHKATATKEATATGKEEATATQNKEEATATQTKEEATATQTEEATATQTEKATATQAKEATATQTKEATATQAKEEAAATQASSDNKKKNLQKYEGHVGDILPPQVIKGVRGFEVDGLNIPDLTAALEKSCDIQEALCTAAVDSQVGKILGVSAEQCAEQNAACRDLAAKAGAQFEFS